MSLIDRNYALKVLEKLLEAEGDLVGEAGPVPGYRDIWADLGLEMQELDVSGGAICMIGSWGEGHPRLCWNIHLEPPRHFGPSSGISIHEDILYRPGCCSSRSSLAAMIAAIKALRAGGKPEGRLDLRVTADPESCEAGLPYVQESGYRCDLAVVGEPTGLDIVHAHAGVLLLEVRTFGMAAHGATPWKGDNAIQAMFALLEELSRAIEGGPEHPEIGRPSFNVGAIQGGDQPSRVPDLCRALVDIRLMPGTDVPEAFQRIDAILKQSRWMDAGYRVLQAGDPMVSSPDSRLVRVLRSAVVEATGRRPRVRASRAWTQADFFRNRLGVEAVVFGPGTMERSYSRHESLDLEQFFDAAESYRIFAEKMLGLESYE